MHCTTTRFPSPDQPYNQPIVINTHFCLYGSVMKNMVEQENRESAPNSIYLYEDKNGKWIDLGIDTRTDDKTQAEEILKVLNGESGESLIAELQPAKMVEYVRIKRVD